MQFKFSLFILSISLSSTLIDQPPSHSFCPISAQPSPAPIFSITVDIFGHDTGCRIRGSTPECDKTSSLFRKVNSCYTANQASYSMGISWYFAGDKADGAWSWPFTLHLPPTLRMSGVPPTRPSPLFAFPLTIIRSKYPRRKTGVCVCHTRYSQKHNQRLQNASCVLLKGILFYEVKTALSNFYNFLNARRPL